MSQYRSLTYRGYPGYSGYPGYYDRSPYPRLDHGHPPYPRLDHAHPYDRLFYGSRWYDYPPSLYHSRDYTYRLPNVTGHPQSKFRSALDYGYPYVSPHDHYGLTEPRYNLLFDDDWRALPKYSKYSNYPLLPSDYDPVMDTYPFQPSRPLRNHQVRLGSTTASFSSDGRKVKMYY